MKLLTVVLSLKAQKLSAVVEDREGTRRRINLNWESRDPVLLPTGWMALVEAEVEALLSEENARARGRQLIP